MSKKDTIGEAADDHALPPSLAATDDPRVLLGVGLAAGAAEIKQAYRSLVLQYHPDKGGNTADFQRIQAAAEALGAGGGERPCVAPARQHTSRPGYAAPRAHQLPLPCASHPSEWRLQEAANSMGYRYLCVVHAQDGPCLALHRDSLGGFQWRRRRPDGRGWFDAQAFANGQGSMVAGMVNMIGAASCTTAAGDDRAQPTLECDRQYEWGNWTLLLTPGSEDGGTVDLAIHNRKLSRSSYCINLTAGGLAILTDTDGSSHNLC